MPWAVKPWPGNTVPRQTRGVLPTRESSQAGVKKKAPRKSGRLPFFGAWQFCKGCTQFAEHKDVRERTQ